MDLGELLGTRIFGLGRADLTVATLLLVLAILVVTVIAVRLLKRAALRVLTLRGIDDPSVERSVSRLLTVVVTLAGLALAVAVAGIWASIRFVLDARIFELGGATINLATLLKMAVIFALTHLASKIARRAIQRAFALRGVHAVGTVGVVTRLVHFGLLLVGFGLAVEAAGIDLAALFAAGAVFAVALGFAVQNIVQNFVAGFILLAERVIKPGDILEVEGQLVRVKQMGIRSTVAQTLNDEDLIIPNSTLVQSSVKNFTFDNATYRLRTVVGVVYSADMEQVMAVLERVAGEAEFRDKERDPVVLLTDFGESSVNFEVSLWIDEPWQRQKRRSDLNRAIWKAFAEAQIVIAFPQLDVHLDDEVAAGLSRLGSLDVTKSS